MKKTKGQKNLSNQSHLTMSDLCNQSYLNMKKRNQNEKAKKGKAVAHYQSILANITQRRSYHKHNQRQEGATSINS